MLLKDVETGISYVPSDNYSIISLTHYTQCGTRQGGYMKPHGENKPTSDKEWSRNHPFYTRKEVFIYT